MSQPIFARNWTLTGNVETLRGAIAASIPKWLREQFTVLLPLYNRTLRLMETKGGIRNDILGTYAFPIDFLLRRSVPMTESAFDGPNFTNFEPNNQSGFRGIAALAKEENEGVVVRFQPMQRKLETALDWYTQDVTLSDSRMLVEQVRQRLNRLVHGHANELNEMLWNSNTLANGGEWGDSGVTAALNQAHAAYSIPFLVNTPRFARIVTAVADGVNDRTVLKAMIPSTIRLTTAQQAAAGFFSTETTMARRQDVGGLRRGHPQWGATEGTGPEPTIDNQRFAFWNVPMRSFNFSRTPRRLDHFISGLEVIDVANLNVSAATGDGINGTSTILPANVRQQALSHQRLVELYNNLLSEDVELPDVIVTHPHVLAWMENMTWTNRRYENSMKQVFGMNVAFFLDVPVMVDPLVQPVSHGAALAFNNATLPANRPLHHIYFLRFGEKGIQAMLNKKRDVKAWDVPVTSDYYMGIYYWQLFINTPMTVGAALNFSLE